MRLVVSQQSLGCGPLTETANPLVKRTPTGAAYLQFNLKPLGPQSGRRLHMNIRQRIEEHIASQPAQKRSDMQELHRVILAKMPKCKLWFLDGKDEKGEVVSNPNIGYGLQIIEYADGKTKDFYQIGMSANTTGISIYILGLKDRKYLVQAFGKKLGKASVTGYCIRFRKLQDIKTDVLGDAILYGVEQTSI